MNPYKILDLPVSVSYEEIRKRYKSLAQLHHPDRGGDEELFKQIKLAYEILSDPTRRKQYNETGNSSTAKSEKDEAIDRLAQLFFDIMYSYDMNSSNLIGVIFNKIKDDLIQLLSAKSRLEEEMNNCELLNQKISKKSDGVNIFDQFLQYRIDNLKREIEDINFKVEVSDIMLSMLKDYEYSIDGKLFVSL